MAQIALGIGTSHGPQLSTPPEQWGQRAAADHRNPALAFRGGDYSFAELDELRGAAFAAECEPACSASATPAAVPRSASSAGPSAPPTSTSSSWSAATTRSSTATSCCPSSPSTGATRCGTSRTLRRQLATMPPGLAVAEVANQPERPEVRHGHSQLGLHLIHEVSRAGFDPGAAKVLPGGMWENHSIPHGWGFILQQVLGGHDLIPIVPVFVNTFWEPNPPASRRCYDFGVALGAAIESFPADLRVGVVGSGGLSHFVIDEDLDRAFIKALIDKDREFMVSLEDDQLRSGTSELRNWVVVGGATADTPLTAQVVDYLPCYRSAAGTGCAMAFMAWQP